VIIVDKSAPGVSRTALLRFLGRARKAAGLRGPVNVVLTSNREMRGLNRRFRRKDRSTDVLSFPPLAAVAPRFSGDIAISVDIAAANAERFGHTIMEELQILVLHGVLHLAGHDHENDTGQMARMEERFRRQMGLADGLIGRVATGKASSRPAELPKAKVLRETRKTEATRAPRRRTA
jgi:probable rRNA maturation factor